MASGLQKQIRTEEAQNWTKCVISELNLNHFCHVFFIIHFWKTHLLDVECTIVLI